jgi:hypothetical protein
LEKSVPWIIIGPPDFFVAEKYFTFILTSISKENRLSMNNATSSQWHKLDRDRTLAMINSVKNAGDHLLFTIATSEAKCAKLPFYKNFLIYRLTNYASLPSFSFDYIGDGKDFYYLDGSPTPIYTANSTGNLALNSGSVLDYVVFFFDHVSGPEGDISVIKDPREHSALDALGDAQMDNIIAHHSNPEISARPQGGYLVRTSLFYLGSLVRATLEVDRSGHVNVTDYQMLLSVSSAMEKEARL